MRLAHAVMVAVALGACGGKVDGGDDQDGAGEGGEQGVAGGGESGGGSAEPAAGGSGQGGSGGDPGGGGAASDSGGGLSGGRGGDPGVVGVPCDGVTTIGSWWVLAGDACYVFFDQENYGEALWGNARTSCINHGGYLVQITSAEENSVVATLAVDGRRDSSGFLWIGLTDPRSDGTLVWDLGAEGVEALGGGYTNWADGEPGDGECGGLAHNDPYPPFDDWLLFSCDGRGIARPYICEFPR